MKSYVALYNSVASYTNMNAKIMQIINSVKILGLAV